MAYGYNTTQQNSSYGIPTQAPQQSIQPLFPQPQGNVYNINSTLEVANVPVGAGISVALCMPENVMFIKTMQNGNPLFYPYKIMPFTNESENTTEDKKDSGMSSQINQCIQRIEKLEAAFKTKKKEVDFEL